jgi:hypothetical protein
VEVIDMAEKNKKVEYKVGQIVLATKSITEDGDSEGSQKAEYPAGNYIHAVVGEQGEVLHLNKDGLPTVRFERTDTATIVGLDEITPVLLEIE